MAAACSLSFTPALNVPSGDQRRSSPSAALNGAPRRPQFPKQLLYIAWLPTALHCARGSPLCSTGISGVRNRPLLVVTLHRPGSTPDLFRRLGRVGGAQRRPANL